MPLEPYMNLLVVTEVQRRFMSISIKTLIYWLFLGPFLALSLSIPSWHVIEYIAPGKLSSTDVLFTMYPIGLLMSLLTPWGWLMYGGLLLMNSHRRKIGIICTLIGALLLGGFWPIWATFLAST